MIRVRKYDVEGMRRIPLQFRDVVYGTEEHGFIPREVDDGAEASEMEEVAYQRYLARRGIDAIVSGGTVYVLPPPVEVVQSDPDQDTM